VRALVPKRMRRRRSLSACSGASRTPGARGPRTRGPSVGTHRHHSSWYESGVLQAVTKHKVQVLITVPSLSQAQLQPHAQPAPQPAVAPPEATAITAAPAKRRRSLRLNGSDRLSALSNELLIHICTFLVRCILSMCMLFVVVQRA
jgi:hypothetical protein